MNKHEVGTVLVMWRLWMLRSARELGKTVSVTVVNAALNVSAMFVFPSQCA